MFRHMNEMTNLQRRMEDLKMQYVQDKETYRIQLVSSLLAAKKSQEQERLQQQQDVYNYEQNENLRKLQEQKDLLQKQIDQELLQQKQRQHQHQQQQQHHQQQQHQQQQFQQHHQQQLQQQLQQLQQQGGRVNMGSEHNPMMFSPTSMSLQNQQNHNQQVLQPVPRIAYVSPGSNQYANMQPQYISVGGGRVIAVSCAGIKSIIKEEKLFYIILFISRNVILLVKGFFS